MNINDLLSKLPLLNHWIDTTIASYAAQARPVADFNFKRLSFFYSPELLSQTKVIVVPKVPVPPLSALGLPDPAGFERGDYAGITFKDTYFVRSSDVKRESLHFHELVHVIQWAHLGVDRFFLAYAAGLAANGYRDNPLEKMAYALQSHFDGNGAPAWVEPFIRNELNKLYPLTENNFAPLDN